LQEANENDLASIAFYTLVDGVVLGDPPHPPSARIGALAIYGEDGFEIYIAPEQARAESRNELL